MSCYKPQHLKAGDIDFSKLDKNRNCNKFY